MRIAIIVFAGIVAGSCSEQSEPKTAMRDLVFLTRDGCVNTTTMKANLDQALRLSARPSEYQVLDLETLPEGDIRRGYPTPTVLVSNRDLFGMAEPQPPYPDPT